jgi:nitrogen fixation protein FixH
VKDRGWYWPLGLVALLVASAGANIALVVITSRDASFAVEPNYYAKALAWDETMAQQARNEALGWSLGLRVDPAGARGRQSVTVRLADRAGAPIEGAQIAVEAFHNARASRILAAALSPEGQGYAAVMPLDRPGLWEFRLRVTRGPEVFVSTLTRDVTEDR